jgi:hypothetical protein
VRNTKALLALVTALLAFAVFGGAVFTARHYGEVRLAHAVVAVPAAFLLALTSVLLGRRARTEHQRTLGRSGSRGFLALVRVLGTIAFLLALTAALALAVFAVLVLVLE